MKSGTPSTTIREKPCVRITVRNAYGDAPAPVFGSPAGKHESSAGLSTAGKATITMPIINGHLAPHLADRQLLDYLPATAGKVGLTERKTGGEDVVSLATSDYVLLDSNSFKPP